MSQEPIIPRSNRVRMFWAEHELVKATQKMRDMERDLTAKIALLERDLRLARAEIELLRLSSGPKPTPLPEGSYRDPDGPFTGMRLARLSPRKRKVGRA